MLDTDKVTQEQPALRAATEEDASRLSQLAIQAKAYWGYPAEFMHACYAELTVTAEAIACSDKHFVVAMQQQELVGFYALERLVDQQGDKQIELGALYVKPQHISKGIGRLLMAQAKVHAGMLGAHSVFIQSDPHAVEFYRAAGAVVVGEKESGSIPGRFLPLLEVSSIASAHSAQASDATHAQTRSDNVRVDETVIAEGDELIHSDSSSS
jgi:N-acetylglutamate synthase-like GNAT family acetyltransferase